MLSAPVLTFQLPYRFCGSNTKRLFRPYILTLDCHYTFCRGATRSAQLGLDEDGSARFLRDPEPGGALFVVSVGQENFSLLLREQIKQCFIGRLKREVDKLLDSLFFRTDS